MNFDSSSSTSSDEIYDSMLLDFIEENRQQQVIEDAVTYVINTDVEEQEVRGSRRKKMSRWIVPRDREGAHDRLVTDYFSDHPLYGDEKFRRRFRMRKPLFMKIVNTLSATDRFFQQHPDATMRLGASGIQKYTAAMRMLAYEYLRKPNAEDLVRLLKQGEERGFPGMMGSIDCMHWE
ncbi:uncharacterized protein LOC110733980 [Chenopodium quinoa]|uniref:uncharacterized protein LOC110733980 n=1 Tax=Chenopodium quinoa TaxID=63459 RepID=UPI000B780925|nr:uncharacterized protein LOC110733980 [Chenopodium quinoa]